MDKSKVLFFRLSRFIPSFRPLFCINNKDVVYSVDVTFLGIFITEDLSWTTHTQYVCEKLKDKILKGHSEPDCFYKCVSCQI
jgi:hypothetical protein